MGRDWTQTIPGASFKGFPFHVEDEGTDGAGRLVALHGYAKAETHGTEDMGRKARTFRVAAYIVGDDADVRAQAFIERCSTPGPGLLVLPITPSQMVRCVGCATNNRKTEMGKVALDLKFLELGSEAGGPPAIPLGDRIAQGLLDDLADTVADAISAFVPDELAGLLPF
ncbi:DNA circularization protein [Methylobacterium phyllosphaerae]|uniref:DNA circularisation protein N-terminus n=1 Tax=Methylobacterium phyllosphaerae TaxID=418223 RepID=A0AAE8L700_9HYPH|nr:DNA circularization N-terminal domain-containing protein [Methylobacterium phyllosphaerae]APT31927.1 DNA circularization protein [Methylobacterium phyllosphaerae]SFH01416.1 DNA circularisation protein N-terminus [Methylobacterium phyllosphaerae]